MTNSIYLFTCETCGKEIWSLPQAKIFCCNKIAKKTKNFTEEEVEENIEPLQTNLF